MTPEAHHRHALSTARPRRVLVFAATLTGATFLLELWGAHRSGSVALLSDAAHVFMDFGGLLFSYFAVTLAERPASDRRTFGLHRLEVLAAVANGLLVSGVALGIAWKSLHRFHGPAALPGTGWMMGLGLAGLAANIAVAAALHGPSRTDVNLRGSFLHVASDALASVGVVAAGALIAATGWRAVDPLVGLMIAALILGSALPLLRESLNLLLEGVPAGLHLSEVTEALQSLPGVRRVKDVHVWGLCSHLVSLSARVILDPARMAEQPRTLSALQTLLRDRFSIGHSTLQLEPAEPDARP